MLRHGVYIIKWVLTRYPQLLLPPVIGSALTIYLLLVKLPYFMDHCTPHIIVPPYLLCTSHSSNYIRNYYLELNIYTNLAHLALSNDISYISIWQWQPILLVKQLIL